MGLSDSRERIVTSRNNSNRLLLPATVVGHGFYKWIIAGSRSLTFKLNEEQPFQLFSVLRNLRGCAMEIIIQCNIVRS